MPVIVWFWFLVAFFTANAAAIAFFFALRLGRRFRTVTWALCSAVIALSPCLASLEAKGLRFLDCVAAVCLLFKIYDAHRSPAAAIERGILQWLLYLPNWFWFVLRRVPRGRSAGKDWTRVAIGLPLTAGLLVAAWALLQVNWAGTPFVLEHVTKVLAFAAAMIGVGQTSVAGCRQLIGPALDPFDHPFAARTPADFWRRWNRPFREFFDQYVFRPMGGTRRPIVATLAVFAVSGLMHEYVYGVASGRVQGWQVLFFMVQGIAAVATLRVRPRGRTALLWWAGTFFFNLATAFFFCQSVDAVIGFYQR